jgi:hypothetical protein
MTLILLVPRKRYWQQIGGVEAMMKYLTDEDQRMRLLAVYACWNFAENCTIGYYILLL